MNKLYLLICLVFCSLPASSAEVIWDGKSSFIDIGKKVMLLEDKEGKLTIEQVSGAGMASQFKPSDKTILNFGFTESFYWLKFSLVNKTNETLWLELAQAHLPVTDLYFKKPDGQWQLYHSGYTAGLDEKVIRHHFQLFPLPAGNHEFYVRFRSYTNPVPIRIWKEKVYEIKANRQKMIYGLYEGVLLFVIINNILLFLSFRRRSYLHYALIVAIYAATTACVMDGYLPYFFSRPDMMFWYMLIPAVNIPVLWLYCTRFLEVKKYIPWFYRFSLWAFGYFVVSVVISQFMPMMQVLIFNQINAVASFALIVTLGIMVGKKGNVLGYYLALTYFIFCAIVIVEAVYIQTGFPPYFFEISHVSVAILIEIFILSYLLSKRFEWEKKDLEKDRIEAQQQLLEKTLENEKIVREQNASLEQKVAERTAELNNSLNNLKAVQNQLIQAEKMASLGELTAGIAHEIQNPLNFVNNFSEVSTELLEEFMEAREKREEGEEEDALLNDLGENLRKITHHGKRADAIVKGMLEHSRASTGHKEPTDINALANEYLRLSYHGLRAKDKSFNAEFNFSGDPAVGKIHVVAQDIGRVLLNLINNAFYAVNERKKEEPEFKPSVSVSTRRLAEFVEIRVKDNGKGIPGNIRQKIFQPFFSTKPTGQGTGLGLSLSYEILVKGHNGRLEVESEIGKGSEFIVTIPV